MPKILVLLLLASLLFCSRCNQQTSSSNTATLYLANQSFDEYDSTMFAVYADDKLLVEDTVVNTYLSEGYWQRYSIALPSDSFTFKVRVFEANYEIVKDTVIESQDSIKVFARFNFIPFRERYNNPEIYQHIVGNHEDFDLVGFADSLYENNVISKSPYLDDSLPTSESITFSIRYD